jgi:hypothetical protein
MRTVADYRKRTQEAFALAQKARESERATLLDIAHIWLRLADEHQAALRQSNGTVIVGSDGPKLSQTQASPAKH